MSALSTSIAALLLVVALMAEVLNPHAGQGPATTYATRCAADPTPAAAMSFHVPRHPVLDIGLMNPHG